MTPEQDEFEYDPEFIKFIEELEATMGQLMTFEEARAETDAYYAGEQK